MGTGAALDYPARYLFRFLDHHGLLTCHGSPQWYTVVGGSRTYVDAIAERLPHVRAGREPCRTCCATTTACRCRTRSGTWNDYDAIVIATHADQALDLLADASRDEKDDSRGVPLLAERDRPAHRRPAAPDRAAGPGVVELPDAVVTRRRSCARSSPTG